MSLRGKTKKRKYLKVKVGVVKLKEKLDKAFSKDKKKATYDDYEKFERFKRSNEMFLAVCSIEFKKLIYCYENYDKTL